MHHDRSFSTLAAALFAALGTVPLAAQAATISVTTIGDSGAAADCTLRQAIVSMNTGKVTGTGCSASGSFGKNDTIDFAMAAFPNGGTNTIMLAGAQLSITATQLTIDAAANDNVTIDASQASRVMIDNVSSGSLTLNHLTLRNGKATTSDCIGLSAGGGICLLHANLALTDSTLSGSSASYSGGGIFSIAGNITLTRSTLSNNTASQFGGGIGSDGVVTLIDSTLSGNSATSGNGGGIYGGNTITLIGSTLSGNSAANGSGGGIFSASFNSATQNVTLANSTLSGNSAQSGGGISVMLHYNNLTLTNATISANSATAMGGGVYSNAVNTVNNSIVAGNTQASGSDLYPGINAGTNNLVSVNPMLAALADNGGPTQTMLPLAGSPALGAGNNANCPATDQRGVRRPQAVNCDIGAVELVFDRIFADNFDGTPTP